MAEKITNYQCPACTGPLHYSGSSGKLECEYCGKTYDINEIEAMYADRNQAAEAAYEPKAAPETEAEDHWDTESAGGEWGNEGQGMRAYTCPSCAAELICDETTAATSCPYCGNPTVVPGQFGGTRRPDYVIPFKLDKAAAVAALNNHYHGKVLLPKAFSKANHIEEIKGIYVPFWLFDADADVSGTYHASISESHKEGDYRVTRTDHYEVYREGIISFRRVPVDGSRKMPDDYMDSIEPFDYNDLKEFSMAYLPGFLADKYDVDAAEASARADERCIQSALDALEGSVSGYTSRSNISHNTALHRGKVRYALMPVWLLTTKWKGKNYLFAMNGQTGKLVGDLPIDKRKERRIFFGTAVAVTILSTLLLAAPIGRAILDIIG